MIRSDDPTGLSLLFHLNSEPWLDEEAYRSNDYVHEFKIVETDDVTPLPAPSGSPFAALIRRRRSVRAFRAVPIPLAAASDLLSALYGFAGTEPLDGGGLFLRRNVPSAGGLFPLEAYLIARNVEGLADGLYHYDVRGHALACLSRGDLSAEIEPIFLTYPFMCNANLIVCLGAVFARVQKKYGPRGYRYLLLEAGHAAQNLCLAAAERGFASLCMGGYFDSRLNRLLRLDPRREGVVYTIAVGLPA